MSEVGAQILALLMEQFARIHPTLDFNAGAAPGVVESRVLLRELKSGAIRLVDVGRTTKISSEDDERPEGSPVVAQEEGEVAVLRQRVDDLTRDNKSLTDLLESDLSGGALRASLRREVLDEVAAFVLVLVLEQVIDRGRDALKGGEPELLGSAAELLSEEPRVLSRLDECNTRLDDAITAEEVLERVRALAQPARRRTGQIDPEKVPNRRGKTEEPATKERQPDQASAPSGLEAIVERHQQRLGIMVKLEKDVARMGKRGEHEKARAAFAAARQQLGLDDIQPAFEAYQNAIRSPQERTRSRQDKSSLASLLNAAAGSLCAHLEVDGRVGRLHVGGKSEGSGTFQLRSPGTETRAKHGLGQTLPVFRLRTAP